MTQEALASFSAQLKNTRENMGLSPQDAASRLNLSPRFIHALENEDLRESTLPPIYLRGYLRSYARLLQITETDIHAVLELLAPTPVILTTAPVSADATPVTTFLENNPYYVRIGSFLISIVLLASVTTWWYVHSSTPSSTVITLNPPTTISDENPAGSPAMNNVTTGQTKAPDQASTNLPQNPSTLAPTAQKTSSAVAAHSAGDEDENTDEQE